MFLMTKATMQISIKLKCLKKKKRVSWPLEGQPKKIKLCWKLNYTNICTKKKMGKADTVSA